MTRGWALLLCAYLLVWLPIGFADELLSSLPSLGMRGSGAIVELILHGLSTAFGAAAGVMLLGGNAAAASISAAAVIVAWLTALQSLFWTVLPRQTAPGERLPLALLASVHAVFWLAMIRRGLTRS